MVALMDVYTSAVHHHLQLYANWPIGSPCKLGDYGHLDGHRFIKAGNVFDEQMFNVKPQPRLSPIPIALKFKTAGVSVARLGVGGSTNDPSTGAKLKAGIKVRFEKGNSVYFRSIKLQHACVGNAQDLNSAILEAFGKGEWDGRNVVVHNIFESGGTTIFVSSADGAGIEIEATGDATGAVDLADAKAGLSVVGENDVGLSAIAAEGWSPLIGLAQIRPKNVWLAWLGLSSQRVQPLAVGLDGDSDVAEIGGREAMTPLIARELGKPIDEVFHFVEIP